MGVHEELLEIYTELLKVLRMGVLGKYSDRATPYLSSRINGFINGHVTVPPRFAPRDVEVLCDYLPKIFEEIKDYYDYMPREHTEENAAIIYMDMHNLAKFLNMETMHSTTGISKWDWTVRISEKHTRYKLRERHFNALRSYLKNVLNILAEQHLKAEQLREKYCVKKD